VSNFILEGSNVSHDCHLIENIDVVFYVSLDVADVAAYGRGDAVLFCDSKISVSVVIDDFIVKLVLKLELFVCIIGYVFDVFFDLEQVGFKNVV